MKAQFPAKEGWLRMEFTMKDKTPRGEEQIKRMASFGKPETYEFGPIEQYGAKIKVILRELRKEAAR